VQLLREGSLAAFVPSLARVLLVGSVDEELESALAARRCEVSRYEASPAEAAGRDPGYDAVVLVAFPDGVESPADFLRNVARGLEPEGRLILDSSRLARAAVRATVLEGGVAAGTSGEPSDDEATMYGRRSVIALIERAGLWPIPAAASEPILEATLRPLPGRVTRAEPEESPAPVAAVSVPNENERLLYAEREVVELRAFFRTIHDGSRRQQEEIARTRSAVNERDLEVANLRAEILGALGRGTDDARERTIEALRTELRDAEGRIADLEMRLANVRAALVELRDGPAHASTE
jgi:hypothetical protein